MPVQNFAHLGICVANPERSIRFYRDLLGFKPLTKLVVSDEGSWRELQAGYTHPQIGCSGSRESQHEVDVL